MLYTIINLVSNIYHTHETALRISRVVEAVSIVHVYKVVYQNTTSP